MNATTGDIAWRVPLGSYDELEAEGIKNAGASNMGGSIATAGGLVFIAATTDSKFRAFDSRTGNELWMARLDATGDAVPMTFMGRNGKQYVVIGAGGSNRFRMIANTADQIGDGLTAFALPDTQTTQARPRTEPEPAARAHRVEARVKTTPEDLKSPGPPLPDGEGKEVVAKMCTRCHGTTVFSRMRMSRTGWEDEVVSMIEKGATGTEDEIRIVVDYMVKHFGAL